MIDGVASDKFDAVGPIVFSPDSKHVSFLERRGEQTHLVVDGVEAASAFDPRLPSDQPIFDDNTTAHFIASRDGQFLRVIIKMAK
jgi:hypothetical protein